MQFIRWLWTDPETMKPVGGPVYLDDRQARRWFGRMVDPGSPTDCYRLILNEAHEPVGEISFHRLDLDSMSADLNIKVASTERRKGYASEAMLLFLDFFFNHLGGRLLTDDVALENISGQQALLVFGFEHDPSVEEVFRLRMTRRQYNALYGAADASTKQGKAG